MKLLYLFSLINKYTFPSFEDFLANACKGDYQLLVLMQIMEQQRTIIELIMKSKLEVDITRIHFIAPDINDRQAPKQLAGMLKDATGILVLGGNAHFYQKMYATPEISTLILEKYNSNIPYAGVSAGAILTIKLGLVKNIAIKPHFSEKKRFNELIRKMKKNKVTYGFGLDNNISLKIIDNNEIKALGKDSFYLFSRENNNEYQFKILKNLDGLELLADSSNQL